MLAVSHSFPPPPSSFYGEMDDSGTIDPAALNAPRMYLSKVSVGRLIVASASYRKAADPSRRM